MERGFGTGGVAGGRGREGGGGREGGRVADRRQKEKSLLPSRSFAPLLSGPAGNSGEKVEKTRRGE